MFHSEARSVSDHPGVDVVALRAADLVERFEEDLGL